MSSPAESDPRIATALAELGSVRNKDALRAWLERWPEVVRPSVVERLSELVRQRVRVDVEEAMWLAEAASAIAVALRDAESLGRGYRAKANALWFQGDCKSAVELFEAAVSHFEQACRPDEVGRTLSSCIQSLSLLGEYQRALEAAARAREIFEHSGDRWRLARLEINVANIHHRQDRFAEALSSYEWAYQQLLPHKDTEGLGVALHNMAVCLIMLNDFHKALECYHSARELCERNGMPLLAAQADYNIAYLYFLRGDYEKAIEGLRATRELCQRNGDAYHAALCDLDEAEIYVELNLTEEAASMAEHAAQQFKQLGMAYEEGRAIANLAIATHQQGDAGRALDLFTEAKNIFEQEKNHSWRALIDLYQALALFEMSTFEPARELCGRALRFFEEAGLERRAILCHLLLARMELDSHCVEKARQWCEIALAKTALIEAPLLKYQGYLLLGHAHRMSGNWTGADKLYEQARSELETLRSSLQGEELKIAFLRNKLDVYENLIRLRLRTQSAAADAEAFHYMEQAKSRSLAELLFGGAKPLALAGAAGKDSERIGALRAELNWYYHRIDIEQTRPEGVSLPLIRTLRAEARQRENEFLRAVRELPHRNEQAGALRAANPVTLEAIRAALGTEATLIEYFQLGSDFVAAILTRNDLRTVRLADASKVTASLRMLEFQLRKFHLRNSYTRAFQAELLAATQNRLRELHQYLLGPVGPALHGGHLVIVPHGVLHYLPFHALLEGGEYLIDRFTISYAPSASIYAMCRQRPAASGRGSLLLGVHDRNAPWIKREIRSVAAVVREPNVFLGAKATADVLRTAGAESHVVHIATHGCFRQDNPMFSSVRLADSYLSLYDLYQLSLPVDLLTLSGCGTGLSVVAAGDEILGLARGLLFSGARALLLTLWDVQDRSTAEFMPVFYRNLLQHNKAQALRKAMLELRKSHPHPYHWAAFILVGDAVDRGS